MNILKWPCFFSFSFLIHVFHFLFSFINCNNYTSMSIHILLCIISLFCLFRNLPSTLINYFYISFYVLYYLLHLHYSPKPSHIAKNHLKVHSFTILPYIKILSSTSSKANPNSNWQSSLFIVLFFWLNSLFIVHPNSKRQSQLFIQNKPK